MSHSLRPGSRYLENSGTLHIHDAQLNTFGAPSNPASFSPPSTPSQRLLEDGANPQYAIRHPAEPWEVGHEVGHDSSRGWTPIPLRPFYWIPLFAFMILLAVALEIALYFSNKGSGWSTWQGMTSESGFMHFVYTLPPIIVAMTIVALLAWQDIEMKKMQPYIDLLQGDSPPQRSLLLDYTRTNNFVVWWSAFWNHHYMVALSTFFVLASLVFQPLGGAVFTVRDTYWPHPLANVTNMAALSLNQGSDFQDLTAFLSAAGFASSSVLYNLGDPAFVHGEYTVGPFEIPTNIATNGTVFANTTAVKSEANCNVADTISVPLGSNSWTNTASFNGCNFTFSVNKTTAHLFGTDVMPDCDNTGSPTWFLPIILWFFTYDTDPPQGSATYCAPTISLWNVEVQVDIASMNLTSVQEIGPLNSTSPFSSLSGNLTGSPLDGRAYNGVAFNMTDVDQFVTQRADAIALQLPSSVLQNAAMSLGGLSAAFSFNSFVAPATQVYTTYLKLIAKTVYFVPSQATLPVEVKSFVKRLWLSDVAVHLLAATLLAIALVGVLVQLAHRQSRRSLRFRHEPGTIASAVSIGAQTNLADILNGQQEEEEMLTALRGKKFRIDPYTMKIFTEGEVGYEQAVSPNYRRSFLGVLGMQGGASGAGKRFSGLHG